MNTKDGIRLTLIDLMDESGVSGKDLADVVGVTKQAVSAWRTGKCSINVENIPAICEYFHISINEFFGRATNSIQEGKDILAPDEQELVDLYRTLPPKGRHAVLTGLRDFAGM